MSGYKLGVAIVVVLAILGGLVFWLTQNHSFHIGPPTQATTGANFMRPIGLAHRPLTFMPISTGAGAGKAYIAAYAYFMKQAPTSAAMKKITTNPQPAKNLVILQLAKMIEAAATHGVSRRYILFTKTLPAPAVHDPIKKRWDALTVALSDLGEAYVVNKHPHKAKMVFGAIMAMGYRLWMHGLLIGVRSSGLTAMSGAAAGERQIYSSGQLKSNQELHAVAVFQRALHTTMRKWTSKLFVVDVINPVPGDMANVARHDQDISWRIAAINELGFARWATPSRSQQQAIVNLLTKLEHNRNPYLKEAAHNALNLTAATINEM